MQTRTTIHSRRVCSLLAMISLVLASCQAGEPEPANNAEKLGFPAGSKVLILHADDAGMCEEANIATIAQLEGGQIQSAAVMVSCPNAEDILKWAKVNPRYDVGLHLTLTAEWKDHRWGPVAGQDAVPGLIDPEGMMWHGVRDVVINASADEVETEIRAQIEHALSMGFQPGHIDTHMGTLYAHPDFVERFLKVAVEYGIPANVIDLSDSLVAARFRSEGYPIDAEMIGKLDAYPMPKLDLFTSAPHGETYEEKVENFKQLVRGLPAGLTEIIFHPSVETEFLKTITSRWQQRVWEAQMFADPEMLAFFETEGIIFTNWKELMERHTRLNP